MAETEVESILREIREQVLAQQSSARPEATAVANVANDNGEFEAIAPSSTPDIEDHLALLDSYLTTTARTWDRLPPVVSNRSGSAARLELWLKRLLKRATRWFTWEQVNFNASVHHALGDLRALLSALDRDMGKLRQQLQSLEESQFVTTEQFQSELAELEVRMEQQGVEVTARLVSEFRERVAHLQEEQRVSFKQLVLETSEAATLEDRARRKTETILEELQHRIEQLEARNSES